MKVIRIILVLLAISAVISLAGYLYTKRKNTLLTADATSSAIISGNTSMSENPADAGVLITKNAPSREIVISASEFKFTPSEITIKKGETVKVTLKNEGKMNHDWFVDGMGGANIDLTAKATSNSIMITPSQKGVYTTYCSISNHRKLGMVGKLIVQ